MHVTKTTIALLVLVVWLLSLARGECQTTYPMLDPRFWYAAPRHIGESRVGSVGTVNKRPAASRAEVQPVCQGSGDATRCALRFAYTFADATDPEEFVGVFLSFGRIGLTTTNTDGTRGPDLDLHQDATFDFTDLMQNARDRGVSIETLRVVLHPDGANQDLTIRVELEDHNSQKMFTRFPWDSRGTTSVTVNLALSSFIGSIDRSAVKLVTIVLEERHVADRVTNPAAGGFDIEFVGLVDENGPCLEATCIAGLSADRALVTAVAQRDFETLLRLIDTKTGASLDRTLFRDLLHWGATGWQ